MSDSLSEWYAQGERLALDGEQVFYRDSAPTAPPAQPCLLLLHGFPTASWDWRDVWATLAQHYRLIAPDFLGFGFSSKPHQRYTIASQADTVAHLLASLGVPEVTVLAHDYGDTVAQELLARHLHADAPGPRLQALCLLNGGLFPEAHHPLRIQQVLAGPAGQWLVHLIDRRRALESLRSVFGEDTRPSEGDLDAYWSLLSRDRGLRNLPAILAYLSERRQRRERWVSALTASTVPTRFVVGMRDPVSGPDMAKRFRELVADADVIEIDSVGHYPQCESPDAVIDALLAFAPGGSS
ncbi:MAG: alpha/beta hydrolase [Pseudomonadota bacterium]